MINPRLNKYVAIRVFPKTNNTKTNDYGDRDVWLTDEPAAGDIEYTYLKLNNASAPYKISPKAGLNSVSTTSGYSLNSASGNSDREWLTWSKTDNKPQNGEGREGLIQFYSGGTPAWSFTADSLDAPAISDVSSLTGKVTVTDNNGLPAGYNIRYTVSTNGNAPADPTASSTIMTNGEFPVGESCILKAVVERYGVVLTAVARLLNPFPVPRRSSVSTIAHWKCLLPVPQRAAPSTTPRTVLILPLRAQNIPNHSPSIAPLL